MKRAGVIIHSPILAAGGGKWLIALSGGKHATIPVMDKKKARRVDRQLREYTKDNASWH
tara:strand:- start:852 stop:1028 length:177 start_codon:yes stop_codon:yes gene_type:complete